MIDNQKDRAALYDDESDMSMFFFWFWLYLC